MSPVNSWRVILENFLYRPLNFLVMNLESFEASKQFDSIGASHRRVGPPFTVVEGSEQEWPCQMILLALGFGGPGADYC
jgi:hypothetical protein